jgi:hypothetical protein
MQSVFSRNQDIVKIAFLNWRISKSEDILNLLNIANGFFLSSISIAKLCLLDNKDKKADILIFPILANANHGIELYLKSLNWMLNKLIGNPQKIEGKHNIKQIYQTVKSKIKIYNGSLTYREFKTETKELEKYISELFEKIKATPKDDKMDFSRYTFNTRYEDHFYVDEIGNVEIDLENFVERFEHIHKKLESLADFLYYYELNRD